MTFVKSFAEETMDKLANKINNYANEERVKIVQVSYSSEGERMYGDRALVLFSKGE